MNTITAIIVMLLKIIQDSIDEAGSRKRRINSAIMGFVLSFFGLFFINKPNNNPIDIPIEKYAITLGKALPDAPITNVSKYE